MPKELLAVAQTVSRVHKADVELGKGKKVCEINFK